MSNKYVIDVGAYAGKHDITIEKANEEIQTKLFSMGYTWGNKSVNVSHTHALYLYIYESPNEIYFSMAYDERQQFSRLDFERNVTVDLKPVFPKKIEYIKLNGKQYEKEKLEQSLKMIEEGKL